VFELQDQVAISVAGVIEPTLQTAEIRRSAERPTVDLTAYDLYLRALPHYLSLERDRLAEARQLFGQAIQRDPHYGRALALAASCHHYFSINGWVDARDANQRQGIDFARRAILAGGDDPGVLGDAALALGWFGENINAAIALIDRALILNPSFARGWMHSGTTRTWAGQPDLAIQHFERSMRLRPRDPTISRSLTGRGIAEFQNRRFDEAVARLVVSLAEAPGYATTYRVLAAAYALVVVSTIPP
jgi:adenylate cyclase